MQLIRLPLLILITVLLTGCDNMAKWAYDTGLAAERFRAGLEEHTLKTEDGIDWYFLRSSGASDKPVVLLVHGFTGDTSNWIRFANELEGDYHLVIPDLPGHGNTTRTLDLDYNIGAQAQRLLTLMSALEIEQFHLAGHSMGGSISIETTLAAPERVLSLGLVNAAGVTIVSEEVLALAADGGGHPLITRKPEDMHRVIEWAMEDPPYMPDFFVELMGEKKVANAHIADKVWADIRDRNLLERFGEIQQPTVIFWGDKDRVLPIDNAAYFKDNIPNSSLIVYEGIGHSPNLEVVSQNAADYKAFLAENTN